MQKRERYARERHGGQAYHKRLRNPDGSKIPRLPRPADLPSSDSSDTEGSYGSNPTPFDDEYTYEERTDKWLFGRPIPHNYAHKRARNT